MNRREFLCAALAGPAPIWRVQTPPPADALTMLGVAEALNAIRSGTISAADLVEAHLARIARLNPELGAFITVTAGRARNDARRAGGGPLRGLPIAHKDLFETAGVRTTAGSRLYANHVPARDAAFVEAFARRGAVLLGKTNTHELGGGVTTVNPFFGTTRNPVDRTRIAGGSSGGSAAAVVGHLCLAATGSDTGGSVRIPAAFCGCAGFKPTFGRFSTRGLLGACPTFDHVGLLARSAGDVAVVFRALTAGRPFVPAAAGRPLRIGVARGFFAAALAPDVARAMEAALERLRRAGATVVNRDLPVDDRTMPAVFDPIVMSEIWSRYGRAWRARPELFSSGFASVFDTPPPSGTALQEARRALGRFQRDVDDVFGEVDAIVTATVPVTAPPIDGQIDASLILRHTWPFNAARTPTVSVPCGTDARGLPIGLQIAGRRGDDDLVLEVARVLETVSGFEGSRVAPSTLPGAP